jgi:hypothetical protein
LYFFFWPLCFFFFSFFIWPLCIPSFFHLPIMIIPLVSSSSSCNVKYKKQTQKRSDIIWTLSSKPINSNILNFDEMGACCS